MTVRCTGCGAVTPGSARWCGRCGAPLDEDAPPAASSSAGGRDRQREVGRARVSVQGIATGILIMLAALIGIEALLGGEGSDEGAGPVDLPSAATGGPVGPLGSPVPTCQIGPTMTVPLIGSPCRRWAVASPGEDRGWLVSGDELYLTDGRGFVESRKLGDGVQRWAVRRGGRTQLRTAERGTLYVTVDDRELLALGRADGTLRWNHRIDPTSEELPGAGERIRRVLATTSSVYLQVGSTITALDADDGSVGWTWSEQHVLSAGTSGDLPYVVVVDGVIGLEPSDGQTRWRVTRVTFDVRPHHASGNDVVIGDDTSQVSLVSGRTGHVRWSRALDALPVSIAVTGEHITVQGRPGRLWSLGRDDGAVRWAVGANPEPLELLDAGSDVVLARTRGRPHVLVMDVGSGRERWRRTVRGLEDAHLRDDEVVIDTDAEILAVDVQDGAFRWALPMAGRVLRATPDPLLVATAGRLVAIDPPAGDVP